jgi:hypothetical protein
MLSIHMTLTSCHWAWVEIECHSDSFLCSNHLECTWTAKTKQKRFDYEFRCAEVRRLQSAFGVYTWELQVLEDCRWFVKVRSTPGGMGTSGKATPEHHEADRWHLGPHASTSDPPYMMQSQLPVSCLYIRFGGAILYIHEEAVNHSE